jgi:hypothetical protein
MLSRYSELHDRTERLLPVPKRTSRDIEFPMINALCGMSVTFTLILYELIHTPTVSEIIRMEALHRFESVDR